MNRLFALLALWTTAILSMGATGCRFFGNYQEGGGTGNSQDPYSGYYEMAPQASYLWVAHSNRGQLGGAVRFESVPADGVNLSFSNPVAFLVETPATTESYGVGRIISLWDTRFYQYFQWDAGSATLKVSGTLNAVPAWDLSRCSYQSAFALMGKLLQGAGPTTTGTSRPISGRIQMNVDATTQFTGDDCPAFLEVLQRCYSDQEFCGPSSLSAEEKRRRQLEAQSIFSPYVQAGIIASTDIGRSPTLSYRIEYR